MIKELFIWSKNHEHCLLAPDNKITFTHTVFHSTAIQDNQSAQQILPTELIKSLKNNCLNTTDIVRLYLHDSLENDWQTLNWESLSFTGKSLGSQIQIIRYAKFSQTSPLDDKQPWLMLDHWENTLFSKALQDPLLSIKRNKKIADTLQNEDLSPYQGLLIIAHGSEQDETCPLLTSEGKPWQIQIPAGLPATVIIIACASKTNNLTPLIQACFEKGAQTVIAAHGQLDDKKMLSFLSDYFKNTEKIKPSLTDFLYQHQSDKNDMNGGVNCLRVYGKLQTLHSTSLADYRALTLNACYAEQDILADLQNKHCIGNESKAKLWLETLLKKLDHLPPITQALLIDYSDYLAEQYAPDQLRAITKQRRDLNRTPLYASLENKFKHYVQAKSARRNGNYEQACLHTVQLYKQLNNEKDCPLLAEYYGLLLNILIDLNLPDTGDKVSSQLDTYLRNKISSLSEDKKNKQYDRNARLFMRQANYTKAIQCYQWKDEDERKLPTLLYAQAWAIPKDPKTKINFDKITTCLSNQTALNYPKYHYELRSLSLALWRTKSNHLPAINTLNEYAQNIIDRLSSKYDKGPAAMSFFYAHLAGIKAYQSIEHLEQAINALDHDSYWFELAVLLCFCNRAGEAQTYLKKYHAMRQTCVKNLGEAPLLGVDELTHREQLESQLITSFNENFMLKNGLLPL